MSRADRDRWDSRYSANDSSGTPPEATLQWLPRAEARSDLLALDLACECVEKARLADHVETEVRERDVLLERRSVARPFRQAMAKHKCVVGE